MQPISEEIYNSKYRLKSQDGAFIEKNRADTFWRVAVALASVEKETLDWQQKFYQAMKDGAIPAGRIMSNLGAEKYKPATSPINCTVSGTIDDSMLGILTSNLNAGLTLTAGCGIGYNFSTLRPKGAYVNGAGATTSGSLSFMDIFDKTCFTVSSAGGRRGAQMGCMHVRHPDIIDFIKSKREDGKFRQFNLSVLITDELIEAMKNDLDWQLYFPLHQKESQKDVEMIYAPLYFPESEQTNDYISSTDSDYGELLRYKHKVYKTLKARKLWDIIMDSTFKYAEPGILLTDTINSQNPLNFAETLSATNPCVTGDTWVQTSNGPRQVWDLKGKQFTAIVNGEEHLTTSEGFFLSGTKQTVKVQTKEGYFLKLTDDHKIMTPDGWKKAGDLKQGDEITLNDHRKYTEWGGERTFGEGYLMGLLMGDGCIKSDAAILSLWTKKEGNQPVMDLAYDIAKGMPHRSDWKGWTEVKDRDEFRMKSAAITALAAQLGMSQGNKVITPAMEKTSSDFHKGFLRGFFDTDGTALVPPYAGHTVRLSQSNLFRLEAVQRMLLRLGIASKIYVRRQAKTRLLPDGKGGKKLYDCKKSYDLVISKQNVIQFAKTIGFTNSAKAERLEYSLNESRFNTEEFTAKVDAVTSDLVADVFDVQVPGINRFDGLGVVIKNCGEQPLPPNGACLLGSIDLSRFVIDGFTSRACFDFDNFEKTVITFTRMLDNVVELNNLPLPEQREEIKNKRRHGMGFTGLGTALTMLRIKYGTTEAVNFTHTVSRAIAKVGYLENVNLAAEKGACPILSTEENIQKFYDSNYIQTIDDYDNELPSSHGYRFTHHSCIAPAGTISLAFCNNASNGVEPSFSHKYTRNVIKEGRKTKETQTVYSKELLAYAHYHHKKPEDVDLNDLPDYFITADQVTPEQHVDMQAAVQHWMDAAVSKTVNVATDISFEDFKDVYLYAHGKGLKGITTFRFNPEAQAGVLVKDEDLETTTYQFIDDALQPHTVKGNQTIRYNGELVSAQNLFEAHKEGLYGKF